MNGFYGKCNFSFFFTSKENGSKAGRYRNGGLDAIENEKENGILKSQNNFIRLISVCSALLYLPPLWGKMFVSVYNKITHRHRCRSAPLNLGK